FGLLSAQLAIHPFHSADSSVSFYSSYSFCSTSNTAIHSLSLHDALPIFLLAVLQGAGNVAGGLDDGAVAQRTSGDHQRTLAGQQDRKSTHLHSSHVKISYAVFCLKKKTKHSLFRRTTLHLHASSKLLQPS